MDFRQLQYVLTLSQERTLLSAAKKLYISSSALSQYIGKLEQELGTPLFKRTKQGWIPTYTGQLYIDMSADVLERQKKAYLQISDIADSKVGFFTVGITPGRGTIMFSEIFPLFKQQYPNVKISLMEGTVLEISEMIAAGKVDLGFVTSILDYPNITTIPQMEEEILLALPRTHPLAHLAQNAPEGDFATLDLRLLQEDTFLLAGKGTTLRTLEDQMFTQAGFVPKIAFETPSLQTLTHLTKGGYSPAFLPRYYADKTGNAVVYFHSVPTGRWELVTAYHKDHYITQPQAYMIELATAYYRNHKK